MSYPLLPSLFGVSGFGGPPIALGSGSDLRSETAGKSIASLPLLSCLAVALQSDSSNILASRSEENNHGVPLGEPLVSFLLSMLTIRCQWRQLGFTFLSSSVLVCVRFSASSSSIRVPKREPTVSVDACLSHLGECLTELTSSYSLDGLANPS
ncbi:hypothetical protein HID58_002817 [Brassica napus]|uniref:Secreted protein n=1 Tax=Brassica napus TaxID=3708 RepID=A0ABQ8ERG3_BRANA|nr:hypothetical protein HID58_002817 [Brassica napus]